MPSTRLVALWSLAFVILLGSSVRGDGELATSVDRWTFGSGYTLRGQSPDNSAGMFQSRSFAVTSLLSEDDGQAADECCEPSCGACDSCCCDPAGGWRDNMSLFFAADGWKNKGDDSDNNNFGFRPGLNTSFALGDRPVRGQVGLSLGIYDFFGREGRLPRNTETQCFITAGLYRRSNVACGERVSWAAVWDQMLSNNWGEDADNISLSQVRLLGAYALNESNELGVWASIHTSRDLAARLGNPGPTRVRAMNQVNLFWHHNWARGADTTAYIGIAENPGDIVLGLSGHSPLNSRTALFGNVHYIIPSTTGGDTIPNGIGNSYAEETWNVSFGLVFYFGPKAVSRTVSGNASVPLLPVADNGTFAVKVPVGDL